MTPEEAWNYLKEHHKAIAMHMNSVVKQMESAQDLAIRVIVQHDTEDIRALIKTAAIHLISLEVETRR